MTIKKTFFRFKPWLVIAGALIILAALFFAEPRPRPLSVNNAKRFRNEVAVSIRQVGAKETRDRIIDEISSAPATKKHTPMHAFGEVLYEVKGTEAISVCDNSFGFGCFHGFFTKAVVDKGIAIVTELDSACIARFGPQGLGCPHGIGHGLGEYLGPDRLLEQLSLCDSLTWKGVLHGCRSGVFMEYNNPTVADSEAFVTQTRAFDAKHPYGPCFTVPVLYQPACVYELPVWWWDSGVRQALDMRSFCDRITKKELQEYCFIGIGYMLATGSNYSPDVVFSGCSQMGDGEFIIWCRAGGSWAFFSNPEHRAQSEHLCDRLPHAGSRGCQEIARRIALGG